MKIISDLPITTKSIEIKLSDGKVQLKISYEKPKIDIADSGNASDSDKEVRMPKSSSPNTILVFSPGSALCSFYFKKQEPPEKSSPTIYKLTKDDPKVY